MPIPTRTSAVPSRPPTSATDDIAPEASTTCIRPAVERGDSRSSHLTVVGAPAGAAN